MPTRIDFRTFLVLESTLLKRLRKAWKPIVAAYHGKIVQAINANDYAAAYEAARHLDLAPVGQTNREFIKYLSLACANFGAKVVSGNRDRVVSSSHEGVLNKVTDNLIYSLEYTLTLQMVTNSLQLIASHKATTEAGIPASNTELLVQKLEPDQYVKEFTSFARGGDKLLQLISSQHSSRLSTWGFVAEAEILGVTKYKVTAVLDGRTSDFCRMMNGHTFDVEDARKTVNQVLALDNPDDIKNVQPWPNQSKASIEEFKRMTAAELTARNLHIPPYHPHCRTLLTVIGKSPRLEKPQEAVQVTPRDDGQSQGMAPAKVTEETFTELGIKVTPAQLQHWNDYMGVNPVEVLSKLSGVGQMDILAGVLMGSYRSIVIDSMGNFKFQVQQAVGDGKASLSMLYDPYNGNLYQNYLEYTQVKELEASKHLAMSYLGMVGLGQTIGAESLYVASSGAAGAMLYAQSGLLPSPVGWFKIKERILAELEEGGKFAQAAQQLDSSDYQTLIDILHSKDESSFYALTTLPYSVDGVPLPALLLEDVAIDLSLDLTDAAAVQQAKGVFK
jgi:hypothetical protein